MEKLSEIPWDMPDDKWIDIKSGISAIGRQEIAI